MSGNLRLSEKEMTVTRVSHLVISSLKVPDRAASLLQNSSHPVRSKEYKLVSKALLTSNG